MDVIVQEWETIQCVKWVFFFNNGEIQENLRHEQNKMVNYNHLVANLVILHNVNAMTKVIRQLRKEGLDITDDMLAGIAPYRRNHIDLLGKYPLRVNRQRTLPSGSDVLRKNSHANVV